MSDDGGLGVDPRLVFTRADHERAAESMNARWEIEKEIMLDVFPSAEIYSASNGRYRVRFTITTRFGTQWDLYLDIDEHYPNIRPEVKTDGWEIDGLVEGDDFNHRYYSDTPCVMDPIQWSIDMSVALVIFKTAKWVDKYEMWLTGEPGYRRWPGAQHVD